MHKSLAVHPTLEIQAAMYQPLAGKQRQRFREKQRISKPAKAFNQSKSAKSFLSRGGLPESGLPQVAHNSIPEESAMKMMEASPKTRLASTMPQIRSEPLLSSSQNAQQMRPTSTPLRSSDYLKSQNTQSASSIPPRGSDQFSSAPNPTQTWPLSSSPQGRSEAVLPDRLGSPVAFVRGLMLNFDNLPEARPVSGVPLGRSTPSQSANFRSTPLGMGSPQSTLSRRLHSQMMRPAAGVPFQRRPAPGASFGRIDPPRFVFGKTFVNATGGPKWCEEAMRTRSNPRQGLRDTEEEVKEVAFAEAEDSEDEGVATIKKPRASEGLSEEDKQAALIASMQEAFGGFTSGLFKGRDPLKPETDLLALSEEINIPWGIVMKAADHFKLYVGKWVRKGKQGVLLGVHGGDPKDKEAWMVRYLPKFQRSIPIMFKVGDDSWEANCALLEAVTDDGISYRSSKDLEDIDHDLDEVRWGRKAPGTDEGDGWIKVNLKQEFPDFNPLEHGRLTPDVFAEIFGLLNDTRMDGEEENLESAWRDADENDDKEVDFKEFCYFFYSRGFQEAHLLTKEQSEVRQIAREKGLPVIDVEAYQAKFSAYDDDGSGEIEYEEFSALVASLLKVPEGMEFPEKRMQQLWREADLDGGGNINFDEFLAFYKKYFDSNSNKNPLDTFYSSVRKEPNCGFDSEVEFLRVEATSRAPEPKADPKKGGAPKKR